MRTIFVCLLVVGAILLTALHASAQDNRWTGWVGCWERVAEHVRDSDGAESPAGLPSAEAPRVCVTPSGPDAVRLTTTVPDQDPIEQVLTADGAPHPIEEGTCRGTETLTWSRNGQRIFARADVTCGVSEHRQVSGLGFITPNGTWLDIRSVTIGDLSTTRVSRYQRVAPEAATSRLTLGGGAPLTFADLEEIHRNTSDEVLEAAIAETNPRLPVSAATLTRLADAGVAPRVIDVIVALAYPDRFIVERTGRISTITASSASPGPFGIDDYYLSGFYYPAYYYSPFGYSYIGWYDPYLLRLRYFGSGGLGGRPSGPGGIQPTGAARAISGEGYTRIRSAGDAQSESGATGRRAVGRPADLTGQSGGGGGIASSGSSNSSGGGSSDGGGSSSGGGGASPGGFSSGGGGDSGRTAQPR
jgi:hypothetical protein